MKLYNLLLLVDICTLLFVSTGFNFYFANSYGTPILVVKFPSESIIVDISFTNNFAFGSTLPDISNIASYTIELSFKFYLIVNGVG